MDEVKVVKTVLTTDVFQTVAVVIAINKKTQSALWNYHGWKKLFFKIKIIFDIDYKVSILAGASGTLDNFKKYWINEFNFLKLNYASTKL